MVIESLEEGKVLGTLMLYKKCAQEKLGMTSQRKRHISTVDSHNNTLHFVSTCCEVKAFNVFIF